MTVVAATWEEYWSRREVWWKSGGPEPMLPWQQGPHIDTLPIERNPRRRCHVVMYEPPIGSQEPPE
jgi:hypothetical protein